MALKFSYLHFVFCFLIFLLPFLSLYFTPPSKIKNTLRDYIRSHYKIRGHNLILGGSHPQSMVDKNTFHNDLTTLLRNGYGCILKFPLIHEHTPPFSGAAFTSWFFQICF